jgi:hypothetical protein
LEHGQFLGEKMSYKGIQKKDHNYFKELVEHYLDNGGNKRI